MEKTELIERLKNANFTTDEINDILLKSDISQEAKDGIAVTEQIEKSAINFLGSFVKSLKSDFKKNLLDILVIILFLTTLLILSYKELINKESTSTLFALIIGYVLAKFKKGFNV